MNKFNFRFLPFSEECEDFFGEVDQSWILYNYFIKPVSLCIGIRSFFYKVTKFKPIKSLHQVFNILGESGLVRLESLMISVYRSV